MTKVKISDYMIGIILFTLVMVGGITMLSEFRGEDSTYGNDEKYSEFNQTFNTLDDITDYTDSLQDSVEESETQTGIFGFLDSLVGTSWNTLKLVFSNLSFMKDVMKGISSFFGVPVWITSLLTTIVTVIIAFAIFAAIFQREL